jgi:hypothetical protein
MDGSSSRRQFGKPDVSQSEGFFRASQWERSVADQFLGWRRATGVALELMRTFAQAIASTLRGNGQRFDNSGKVAMKLQAVLGSCDNLAFDDVAEALAYAGLHLLDRYGRVNQVLEYLFGIGRLPLRICGARVLEVGAGPAPAVYAARDFYLTLLRWPGRGDVKVGPLAISDTLDRGRAWDPFLHHLSQTLVGIRGAALQAGSLTFSRSIHEFEGFDVWRRHHRSVADSAARIVEEFDQADEWISDAAARQLAYEEGVQEPSAYDMIFLCNFLTHPLMSESFEAELHRLAWSLTPGGILVILGSTGRSYPEVFANVRAIAARAQLLEVSPKEPFAANPDPEFLALVAEHVRKNVRWALEGAPAGVRSDVAAGLPGDVVNSTVRFRLPNFRAVVFVRQGPLRRRNTKRTRRRDRGGDGP